MLILSWESIKRPAPSRNDRQGISPTPHQSQLAVPSRSPTPRGRRGRLLIVIYGVSHLLRAPRSQHNSNSPPRWRWEPSSGEHQARRTMSKAIVCLSLSSSSTISTGNSKPSLGRRVVGEGASSAEHQATHTFGGARGDGSVLPSDAALTRWRTRP